MERPTETRLRAAIAVLVKYAQQTRGVAAENQNRVAAYSILSCFGGPGAPAAEYADVVKAATDGEVKITDPVKKVEDGVYEVGPNPYGIVPGTYYSSDARAEDDEELDELPDRAELDRMTKAKLTAQIAAEGLDEFIDTNAEMVEYIMQSRGVVEDD